MAKLKQLISARFSRPARDGTAAQDGADQPSAVEDGCLQYRENGLIVRIYLKEGVTRVGRSRHMDYSVNGPSVSRAHAEFVRRGNRYYVRDTNSTCGTFLNDSRERIPCHQEFEIHAQDVIRLGNVKMTLLLREGAVWPPETRFA